MNFLKDLGIALVAFAIFGSLTATGILRPNVMRIVQDSIGMAIVIYAGVLIWSGWYTSRPLRVRMYAMTAAWFFQAISVALNAEGMLLLVAVIASIGATRYILRSA